MDYLATSTVDFLTMIFIIFLIFFVMFLLQDFLVDFLKNVFSLKHNKFGNDK
jgi:hypothetical protein